MSGKMEIPLNARFECSRNVSELNFSMMRQPMETRAVNTNRT